MVHNYEKKKSTRLRQLIIQRVRAQTMSQTEDNRPQISFCCLKCKFIRTLRPFRRKSLKQWNHTLPWMCSCFQRQRLRAFSPLCVIHYRSRLSAVLADFKVFPPSNCLTIITSIVCYILAGTYILYISEDQRSVKRRHQELRFILKPKSLKLKSENLK